MPAQRPVYVCPHCKTRIPFGTDAKPPARRCPGCQADLSIPSILEQLPWIEFVCPACSSRIQLHRWWAGRRGVCPRCGSVIDVPHEPVTGSVPQRRFPTSWLLWLIFSIIVSGLLLSSWDFGKGESYWERWWAFVQGDYICDALEMAAPLVVLPLILAVPSLAIGWVCQALVVLTIRLLRQIGWQGHAD
jgi:uncharacterized paraquat-inducible protein A